jgi:peptidoglycan/LPS O-acetylase OafA/YrhL
MKAPLEPQIEVNPSFVTRLDVQATANLSKAHRIPALDFTKGVLVLIMVLYHWINYFIGPEWKYYEYLRFLTPSFIFITGFMISNVYLSKYDVSNSRLPMRLFTRGIKLMAVFLALNLARIFLIPALGTGVIARNVFKAESLFAIFVSGDLGTSGGKLGAFPILVPISYLLMLAAGLMFPYRFFRYTFHVACALIMFSILIIGLTGVRGPILESVAIGMLGVLIGFVPIATINDFVRHPFALALGYVCHTIAITVWGDPFPILIVGVALSLSVIYLAGLSNNELRPIKSMVILLGKYSLFGYLSQIAILQILSACFRRVNLEATALVISFFVAFAFTIASVEAVDRARASMPSVDRLYKTVFA